MKRSGVALVAAALVASPLLPAAPAAAAVRAKRVVECRGSSECWPAAFAFTPDGDALLYAERFSGQIRVVDLDTGSDRRWARIAGLSGSGEQGVLGLAVDPRWPRKRFLYAYYTDGSPLSNKIVRIAGGGGRKTLISIPAAQFHNGGVIHFGRDGFLYAVTGDAQDPARSQDRVTPAGKVLRMTKTGKRPSSNPFAGSRAWSIGHRNSFGFAFDPETGNLWQSENGPECTDEMNLVRKGENYGWGPGSDCPDTSTEGPSPVRPEHVWNPVVAPTGVAFCDGCGLGPKTEGAMLVGDYNTGRIRRLRLTKNRQGVAGESSLYDHGTFVLAVEAAPNGSVYFSDDRAIYRLVRA